MARVLGITEATVKVHLKSLLRKIGVDNRTQAAIWVLSNPAELTHIPRGFVWTETCRPSAKIAAGTPPRHRYDQLRTCNIENLVLGFGLASALLGRDQFF